MLTLATTLEKHLRFIKVSNRKTKLHGSRHLINASFVQICQSSKCEHCTHLVERL